ncbi:MAG: mitochondrial fission ELM1 family protein [Rariglobus sp.]
MRHIRVLSDGRPGHENQSVGLAEALCRRTGSTYELVRLGTDGGFFARLRRAKAPAVEGIGPDLIIAAGHSTHLPLLAAARHFCAKSVVIMKPTLPAWLFDLCLVPRHDYKHPRDTGRVMTTRGALNRIPEDAPVKTNTGVIMIGGPSKHHGWDAGPLPAMIAAVVRSRPELAWTIGDSRRTPAGFLEKLDATEATIVPHQQTRPGWLPAQLAAAREVWVTEDSVSMVFEALTARARVGVLPMPVKNAGGRPLKALSDLVADGYVQTYEQWTKRPVTDVNAPQLHETARCADVVLARFFQ